MTTSRILVSAALVGLCACSLIKKNPLGGGDASSITADANDSPAVKNKLDELAKLETQLAEKQWTDYARGSSRLHAYFLFENGLAGESKRERIMKRLDELDTTAYQEFPRLKALVADSARLVDGVAAAAMEPLVAMLDACDGTDDIRSRDALAEKGAAYERAVGRVKQVDAKAFRFYGDTKSKYSTKDIPNALLACESNLAAAASRFAEEYVEETVPATEVVVGCGSAEILADGIRTGPSTFAAYTRTEGGASYPEKLDCKKLPKKSKYGAAFAAAVADYARYIEIPPGDLVVIAEGKPFVDESDSDGYLHRYQKLVVYSKKFRFAKNPCGGEKIACEAGGSKAALAFNRLEHALARAQVNAGSNPAVCKAHLEDVKARAAYFGELRTDAKKDGSWVTGLTYKTTRGTQLDEASLATAFEKQARLADERLLGAYCDTKSK